jgi:hypothetical protein
LCRGRVSSKDLVKELPEEYLEVIREANRLDIELYDYAKTVRTIQTLEFGEFKHSNIIIQVFQFGQ